MDWARLVVARAADVVEIGAMIGKASGIGTLGAGTGLGTLGAGTVLLGREMARPRMSAILA